MRRAVELFEPAFGATRALALAPDLAVLCFDADVVIYSMQGSLFDGDDSSPERFVGRALADALQADHAALLRPACEAALVGACTHLTLPPASGRASVAVSVEPVRILAGAIIGGILVAREVRLVKDVREEPWSARAHRAAPEGCLR